MSLRAGLFGAAAAPTVLRTKPLPSLTQKAVAQAIRRSRRPADDCAVLHRPQAGGSA
ncbi:hypothetical protein GCM10023186_46480 [Hymenobacter koreensis]|uniref:Uncharacterized protein n=1 Tax=Hymenobacter koreensis TaxID=1084523 RepID=A0ABP8JPR7_9BACT